MSYSSAGFWNRFSARILDMIIVSIVISLISVLIYGDFYLFAGVNEFRLIDLLGILYGIILPVIWYGYTLGRRVAGNRIITVDGSRVGIKTMLKREVVAGIIYVLTLGIGFIISAFMIGFRKDKRAIHDFIAGTCVTKAPYQKSQTEFL